MPDKTKPTINPKIAALAARMHYAPCRIADYFTISPDYVERLLVSRGQRPRANETLIACIARHYGDDVAKDLWDLIGEETFLK